MRTRYTVVVDIEHPNTTNEEVRAILEESVARTKETWEDQFGTGKVVRAELEHLSDLHSTPVNLLDSTLPGTIPTPTSCITSH